MFFLQSSALKFDWTVGGHVITLLVLTILFVCLSIYYSEAIKKADSYSKLPKLAFLIFLGIQWVKKNTYQILGKSYKRVVPFFIYIISLFWFSNLISILGFDSIGTSIVVPFSLAMVVFVGTIVVGIIHRGISYFGDYFVWIKYKKKRILPIPDPLKFIGELSKVVSLACRLWGNTLAGSLILFVIYKFSEGLFSHEPASFMGPILVPLFVFPLHIYFDIIDGTIQPMIFMLLTMCYWTIAKQAEGSDKDDQNHELINYE